MRHEPETCSDRAPHSSSPHRRQSGVVATRAFRRRRRRRRRGHHRRLQWRQTLPFTNETCSITWSFIITELKHHGVLLNRNHQRLHQTVGLLRKWLRKSKQKRKRLSKHTLTCVGVTSGSRWRRASASDNRIMLSSCLTVMRYELWLVFLPSPSRNSL
jgi:hypothetical protein